MIDLYDIVYGIANTCESFKDPRVYQAWKSLQDAGVKWKDVFKGYYYGNIKVQWDKVGDDQIEEVDKNDIQDFIKRARRIKAGKGDRPVVAFCFQREKLVYVFDPCDTELYDVSKKRPSRDSITEIYSEVAQSDYLLVVYTDVKTAREVRVAREEARNGSWTDLTQDDHQSKHLEKGVLGVSAGGRNKYDVGNGSFYAQCKNMALDAVKRRKEIIANNKINKGLGTEEIDKLVEKSTNLFLKLSTWAIKNPDKINRYDLERISDRVTDKMRSSLGRKGWETRGENGILFLYSEYCQTVLNIQSGETLGWTTKDELLKKKTEEEKVLKEKCETFIKLCSDYGIK